jgi:hypothetical protein
MRERVTRLQVAPKVGAPIGNKNAAQNNDGNATIVSRTRGSTVANIMRRLNRDRPDLAMASAAGRGVGSPFLVGRRQTLLGAAYRLPLPPAKAQIGKMREEGKAAVLRILRDAGGARTRAPCNSGITVATTRCTMSEARDA